MDNAIVNLPLAKRGNIDAQLDRYKREQAAMAERKRKEVATQRRSDKADAKSKLAELIAADGLIDAKAQKLGTTRKALVEILTSWSKWEPKKVIKAHAEWIAA